MSRPRRLGLAAAAERDTRWELDPAFVATLGGLAGSGGHATPLSESEPPTSETEAPTSAKAGADQSSR